jgi:hypothetical protein
MSRGGNGVSRRRNRPCIWLIGHTKLLDERLLRLEVANENRLKTFAPARGYDRDAEKTPSQPRHEIEIIRSVLRCDL